MMLLQVVCLITLQLVYSQIQKKDPSVCDGATIRYELGYNPHPYDCTQYVQCFYYPNGRVEPVYRNCEYGQFWEHSKLRCLPADQVNCKHDKCHNAGVAFYKHSDPNKCNAYWVCEGGKAFGKCCLDGQAFHPTKGCIPMPSCTDMCPLKDRIPGCSRRPISGSPTRYEQYTDNGIWKKVRCPKGAAYNPVDCECSIKEVIKAGRVCKPDVVLNFDEPTIRDVSGNNNKVTIENVQVYKKTGYFNGMSKLVVDPLKPSANDEGVLVIKMRYREDLRKKSANSLQAMVTNGNCGQPESVVIGKLPGMVLLGAETNTSRMFPLPTVNKPWKEIIYIHDKEKLEGRVCGAASNEWSYGQLKDTGCGFQFGASEKMAGYVGLLDDIYIYRCKPLDTVINLNY